MAQMIRSGTISGTPPNCHICGGYGPFPVGLGLPAGAPYVYQSAIKQLFGLHISLYRLRVWSHLVTTIPTTGIPELTTGDQFGVTREDESRNEKDLS